jgi:hypothetical protein
MRSAFIAACVLVVLLASTRRANAASRPPDLVSLIGRAIHASRTAAILRERNCEVLGRDVASLGIRSQVPHAMGASLAAIGTAAWAFSSRGGLAPLLIIGPRLYNGGGGVGISLRW